MRKLILAALLFVGCKHPVNPPVPPPPSPSPTATPTPAPHPGATVLTPTTTIAAETRPNTAMSPEWQPLGGGAVPTPTPGSTPTPTPAPGTSPTPTPTPTGVNSRHVIFVMEENHPETSITSSSMPYLVGLGTANAFTRSMSAIAPGSLLDYLAKASGSTETQFGCNGTNCSSPITDDNEYRQFIQNGLSWHVYAQSLPSACYMGDPNNNNGPYVKRHNDAPWYSDVISSPTQQCNIVPFTQWATDIANNSLPNYSFIVPDLNNDAHNGTLAQADSFLQQALTPLLSSPYCTGVNADCVIIVTFDETSASSECCIYTAIIGPHVLKGTVITTPTTSYALLRLTMELFGINDFPGASNSAGDALRGVF